VLSLLRAILTFLALIALGGLDINAFWTLRWAGPVAVLALVPLIVRELYCEVV
jgi:hypothetical protein